MAIIINKKSVRFLEIISLVTISSAMGLIIKYGTWEEIIKDVTTSIGAIILLLVGIFIWYNKENWSEEIKTK